MSVLSRQLSIVNAREVFSDACDYFSDHTQRLSEVVYEEINPDEFQEAVLALNTRRIWGYAATARGESVRIGDVLRSETRYAHLPKVQSGNLQIGPLVMSACTGKSLEVYRGFALYAENQL